MGRMIDATKLGPVALAALAEMDADADVAAGRAKIARNDRLDAEARRRWPDAWAHMGTLAKSQRWARRSRLRQRAAWAIAAEEARPP